MPQIEVGGSSRLLEAGHETCIGLNHHRHFAFSPKDTGSLTDASTPPADHRSITDGYCHQFEHRGRCC